MWWWWWWGGAIRVNVGEGLRRVSLEKILGILTLHPQYF